MYIYIYSVYIIVYVYKSWSCLCLCIPAAEIYMNPATCLSALSAINNVLQRCAQAEQVSRKLIGWRPGVSSAQVTNIIRHSRKAYVSP